MADALPPPQQDGRADRRAHRTLLLIAAVCMAPIVASYTIYYFFPREPTANHGTLLPAAPAPAIAGVTPEGAPFALADVRGRWAVVIGSAGGCEAACARGLYATRQARTMQDREQERVIRILLVADGAPPPQDLLAAAPRARRGAGRARGAGGVAGRTRGHLHRRPARQSRAPLS